MCRLAFGVGMVRQSNFRLRLTCLMLLNHSPVGSIQAVWGVTKACQQSAMAWMYCLALAAKVSQQWLLMARVYLFSSETCFFLLSSGHRSMTTNPFLSENSRKAAMQCQVDSVPVLHIFESSSGCSRACHPCSYVGRTATCVLADCLQTCASRAPKGVGQKHSVPFMTRQHLLFKNKRLKCSLCGLPTHGCSKYPPFRGIHFARQAQGSQL